MGQPKVSVQHRLLDNLPDTELVQASYQQFQFDRHVHDDIHIGVVDQGAQQFCHQGAQYLLAPQRLSLINPDEVHDGHGVADGNYRVQLLRISPLSLAEFARSIGYQCNELYLRGPDVVDAALYHALLNLHYQYRAVDGTRDQSDCGQPLQRDTQLTNVLTQLIQRYAEPHKQSSVDAGERRERFDHQALAKLKSYLYADLAKPHRLSELAGLFDLSEYQFLRRFRATMGITPHAYLLALRVDYARQCIRQQQSLTESAFAAGFYDQSHFCRVFKRRYNLTPAAYQQQVVRAIFYKPALAKLS